ncbi:hypothetical protein [Zooshikella sp. RANM57]|uniref:hypothetical protein n=1 Tax=Zooshikella sp. RANM57 TaxID=3425863 RepID=UPI003D6EC8CB
MAAILGLLCFIIIIAFVIGMIKPDLVLKKKQATRRKVVGIYGGAFVVVFIVGCIIDPVVKSEPIVISNMLSVSDFPYTMGDKQAVSFHAGPNKDNYLDITILRENVKEGKSFNSIKRNNNSLFSTTLHWDGKTYYQSANADTWATMSIEKLTNDSAIISFSGQYADGDNDKLIKVGPSRIELKEQNLHNFVTMPEDQDN